MQISIFPVTYFYFSRGRVQLVVDEKKKVDIPSSMTTPFSPFTFPLTLFY
jgi:hypothetical protein